MTGGGLRALTGLGYGDPDGSRRGEMNEKRRACAHINSSVRRGQQAVPAKMPRIGSGASATAHAITFRDGLGVWHVRVLDQLVQLASEENGVVQPDVPVWLGHLRHQPASHRPERAGKPQRRQRPDPRRAAWTRVIM